MSPARHFAAALLFALLLHSPAALAIPGPSSGADDDEDLSLEVRTLDNVTGDGFAIPCEASLRVVSEEIPLSEGDTVLVEVRTRTTFEVFSELLFEQSFEIDAATAEAGVLEAEIDCTHMLPEDWRDRIENGRITLNVSAESTKAECGFFTCLQDNVSVSFRPLASVDDTAMDNDTPQSAQALDLAGAATNGISADPDFFSFESDGALNVVLAASVLGAVPAPQITLVDGADFEVARIAGFDSLTPGAAPDDPFTVLSGQLNANNLAPGAPYYFKVLPAEGATQPVFYELRASFFSGCQCAAGEEDVAPCGRCGTRRRSCGEDCLWGSFEACEGESGSCTPGRLETGGCGNCGTRERLCNTRCEFTEWSECSGEGECRPEQIEVSVEGCDVGSKQRICDASCRFGEFSECAECTEGETRNCYEGRAGTEGVGGCTRGEQTCTGGTWGSCEDQVLPEREACDDGVDNDCDGNVDEGCAPEPTAGLGEACTEDSDCVDGDARCEALGDGMGCVVRPCTDCGAGVCVSLGGSEACLPRCDTSSDCPDGLRCDDRGNGRACVPACEGDADCTKAERPRCNDDTGLCEPAQADCAQDADCPMAQLCREGLCVMASGASCIVDDECGPGLICIGDHCRTGCSSDADCAADRVCMNSSCVDPGAGNNGGDNGGDNGNTNGGVAAPKGGGGCAQSGDPAALWPLALLLVPLGRRRRGRLALLAALLAFPSGCGSDGGPTPGESPCLYEGTEGATADCLQPTEAPEHYVEQALKYFDTIDISADPNSVPTYGETVVRWEWPPWLLLTGFGKETMEQLGAAVRRADPAVINERDCRFFDQQPFARCRVVFEYDGGPCAIYEEFAFNAAGEMTFIEAWSDIPALDPTSDDDPWGERSDIGRLSTRVPGLGHGDGRIDLEGSFLLDAEARDPDVADLAMRARDQWKFWFEAFEAAGTDFYHRGCGWTGAE